MSPVAARLALVAAAILPWATAADPVPADSVYRLSMEITDQSGLQAGLDRNRGHPVLVSMFYASCPHVCPMLISTIGRIERELPPADRARMRVLMVSLDPERDTPAKLAELAARHRADLSRWTFGRADGPDVRKLAAVLDIRYRRLQDGEFNHSTAIVLLDGDGRIVARTESMLRLDPEFVAAVRAATRR